MNINLNAENSSSQTRQILSWMKAGNRINPIEALRRFGSFRLGARIKDIEELIGYPPSRQKIQVENRQGKTVWVNEYWLEGEPAQ